MTYEKLSNLHCQFSLAFLCTARPNFHWSNPLVFFFIVSFLFTLTVQWCWIISLAFQDSLLCFVVSCHSFVFFFLFPAPLQKRTKKDRVYVGGVQARYREIDEAVRAGVITRCPFPKPDWQTANITQTPGPDRHTTTPHHPTQSGKAEHPNLQPSPNGVWAN